MRFFTLNFLHMTNSELIQTARQAMKDLSATNMLEHEQTAYNCLRLLCGVAEKYEELKAEISECYGDDEFEEEGDGLISIGEIAASHFGFM